MNVLVLFGGCSSEYEVSLHSAAGVLRAMAGQFTPVTVGITRQGNWLWTEAGPDEIERDAWREGRCVPAALSASRGDRSLLLLDAAGTRRIGVDCVFPVLHGKNGEDGTVQGLCALAGLPLAGCGVLASALAMDKVRAHALAARAGVAVPEGFILGRGYDAGQAAARAAALGWPVFVKPVKAGSSYGVSRVTARRALLPAIEGAFRYDDEVLVERAVPGFEVGCAVMGNGALITGEPDEVELAGGFFDYREKYNLITARLHVPARISPERTAAVKQTARTVYRALGCRGFARVDLFCTPEGRIVFNEVNTIPGFTAHSRFPAMMAAAGMDLPAVVARAVELAMEGER